MQHSQDFKRRGVNFSDGRQLRAYRKSLNRKSWRDDIVMKRRSSSSDILDENIRVGGNGGNRLSPLKEKNEELAEQPVKPKKLTGAEERKLQLIKYKERKQLLKELEKQKKQSRPVFKVCHIKQAYDPFATISTFKPKTVKPVNTEEKRVTRSAAKMAATTVKPVPVPKPIRKTVKTNAKSKPAKRTNECVINEEPKEKRAKRVSFAPDGFQFTAPENLKFPTPRKTPVESEKDGFTFASPGKSILNRKTNKIQPNDEITVEGKVEVELSSDVENLIKEKEIEEVLKIKNEEAMDIENEKRSEDDVAGGDKLFLMMSEEECETQTTEKENNKCSSKEEKKNEILVLNETPKARDFDVENFISPFVTTSRGSSSKKKRRMSLRRSLMQAEINKHQIECSNEEESIEKPTEESERKMETNMNSEKVTSPTEECELPIEGFSTKPVEEDKDENTENEISNQDENSAKTAELDRFKGLVVEYKQKFEGNINYWLNEKSDDLPEIARNEIDSTIGMAELLMNQRFSQFEDLIADCELNRGEKEVTCDDLLGFWEMIYHQVTNIEAKFDKIHNMKVNNWNSVTPKRKRGKRRVKKATPKAKPKAKSSGLRAHIAAARKLKKEDDIENEVPDLNNSKLNLNVNETPIEEENARVTRSSNRREGSISYLLQPSFVASDDDVFFSPEKEEIAVNKIVQSVLKSSNKSLDVSTPDSSGAMNGSIKPRRSVRFAKDTKLDENTGVPDYRTTPFTTRRKSTALIPSTSSEEIVSSTSSDSYNLPENSNHTNCTLVMEELSLKPSRKSRRKVSLLPLGNVINIIPCTTGDLMSFSPLENNNRRRTRSFSKAC